MSIDSLTGFKAMCGCFTGLTVIAVSLRFLARKKNQSPLQSDDWFMLAALVLFIGCMTDVFLLARVGFSGYNGGEGSNQTNIFVEQVTTAFQLLTIWTLGAAKASALFFYKRVFCQPRGTNSALRAAIIVTLVINAGWVIGFFFLGLFQCGAHFSYGGNHFSYCTHLNQFQQGFYISDIILDVWIMIMPLPYIIRLDISLVKKLLTTIVFLLGCVALGASIARLADYYESARITPGASSGGSTHVRTRSAWTAYLWYGTLEMGAAVVALNLPILYGLLSKYAPDFLAQDAQGWTSMKSRAWSSSGNDHTRLRQGSVDSGEHEEHFKAAIP